MEDFQEILTERLQILAISFFVFFLLFLVAKNQGYFSFYRPLKDPFEKLSNQVFLWAFGFFLILQLFIIPFSFQFWYYFYTLGEARQSQSLTPEIQGWTSVYGIVVSGIGMGLYFFAMPTQNQKIVLGAYALRGWKTKFQDFFIACMSWALSYPLVVGIGQVVAIILMFTYQNIEPEQVAVKQIKFASTSTPLLVVLIACVIFIVPFVEEVLFRGFFQNWLKKFMNQWKAIIFTSLIFALFHFSFSQGMGNIELLISLFVLSCFLGFIYERQKSLWAPISLHAIFNAVSIMLIFFVEK